MLTTPKDPPGSASSTVSARLSPVLDEPDPALETARLRHEVALLTVRQEIEQARAATGSSTPKVASGEAASPPAAGAGTVAWWVAHDQLGVAVEAIGDAVARALGVVPKAERVAMSEAVTEALVKSARDHLDRAAVAEISGVHRTALERACVAALDRQAQLSIDEARRRNSLQDATTEDAPPLSAEPARVLASTSAATTAQATDATAPNATATATATTATATDRVPGREDTSSSPRIRVLVTDDPFLASSDWRAQHLAAQTTAHVTALQRLSAQTAAASRDLETTLDCWVRGAPPGTTQPSAAGGPTPTGQWLAQAGIADAAAAVAGGVKILAGAGFGQGVGVGRTVGVEQGVGVATNGAGSATSPMSVSPLTLSLQLLELASSDLALSHRAVSVGTHELVMRGAGALATNLGPQATVVADGMTTLNPSASPLVTAVNDLLQQRNDLASGVAGLAGIVSFARSLAGLDEFEVAGATVQGRTAQKDVAARQEAARHGAARHEGAQQEAARHGAARHEAAQQEAPLPGPTLDPGLRELARQALLHERLVAHVVESLGAIDRDVRAWMQPGDGGETPPLLAAIRRERLHAGTDRFTHVLVLQDEGLTADVISRRSIVGDSGRLTHVASASVSWLLIDVESGAVVEGGQASPAQTLVQDIGSGRTTSLKMDSRSGSPLPWDAQHTLELALKFFAVAAGLAALIFSIVAIVNVFLT